MRTFRFPAAETAFFDNCRRNRRIIVLLGAVMLLSFLVSLIFVWQIPACEEMQILCFYRLVLGGSGIGSMFFRELLTLYLFLLLLGLFSLHLAFVPLIWLFFLYRGFALAVFVRQIFCTGVFVGIAGLFFLLPFVLFNYLLLTLFGAYAISCAKYFRRNRCIDFATLWCGLWVYALLVTLVMLLELLLFFLILRPFFGLFV